MSTLDGDLPAARVAAALEELAAATSRLSDAVERLAADGSDGGGGALDEPSRLPGWSRRTLLAHLHAGAIASARMTGEALAGRSAHFYPGGPDERIRKLHAFDEADASVAVATCIASAQELVATWVGLPPAEWQRSFTEGRFGEVRLSRLLVLRLTELNVHGEDLYCGLNGWSPAFVDIALPLRIAWLPAHHRARRDTDISVTGRWLLSDGSRWWLVRAGAEGASVAEASADETADASLCGTADELLRVLLGRLPVDALAIDGDMTSLFS